MIDRLVDAGLPPEVCCSSPGYYRYRNRPLSQTQMRWQWLTGLNRGASLPLSKQTSCLKADLLPLQTLDMDASTAGGNLTGLSSYRRSVAQLTATRVARISSQPTGRICFFGRDGSALGVDAQACNGVTRPGSP